MPAQGIVKVPLKKFFSSHPGMKNFSHLRKENNFFFEVGLIAICHKNRNIETNY